MHNEIQTVRDHIRNIDEEIIKLLQKRVCLCNKIGVLKKQKGLKIKDAKQEKKVLSHIQNTLYKSPEKKELTKLFSRIIKMCRKAQQYTE